MRIQGTNRVRAAGARVAGGVLMIAALVMTAASAPSPAAAQGWIDPLPGVRDWGVVKVRTDVSVRINGRVAEVEVEEWFENRGGGLGEGDYLYPLPGEAVFSNFSLYQGDRELTGETMDADRARGIYEEIVRQRKDPALIELVGHGLVRARVFPIEPGQTRRITLRFTQVLDRAGDALQFRYAAGGETVGLPPTLGGPVRPPVRPGIEPAGPGQRPRPDGAPLSFSIEADGGQFGEPFSPTHELEVERRDGRLRVRPARDLRGDFSVFLPLARGQVGISLAAHRPVAGEPGYFMLTLSPGTVEAGTATARDITAVVDVSGSMSGPKMEQTRQALHQLLDSLSPRDRFRLLAFSNRVRSSAEGWTRADPESLRRAHAWVDDLDAEGGTNIAGALEEAFRLTSPEDRLPMVLFLTDGLPTVGEQDPERIAAEAEGERGRARVFAFGVGYDVNAYLLDRLSAAGRGATEYVEPGASVETAVGSLARKITHPVLTDLELDGSPVRLTELYPERLPDLFAGEELVLFGRYEGAGGGQLRLAGRRADRVERFGTVARFPGHAEANDYIPRLWASRKLGELTRQVRLNGPDPELVEEIRRTALRYGLLSEYTSYLVEEPLQAVAMDQAQGVIRNMAPPPAPPMPERNASMGTGATGAAAVQASKAAGARRAVASEADLARAEEAMESRAAAGGHDARVIAGRTFLKREGVWTDAAVDEEMDVVAVKRFSGAYFELLRRLPELKPVVAELETVKVAGARIVVLFADDGRESLDDRAADRIAADFRGAGR